MKKAKMTDGSVYFRATSYPHNMFLTDGNLTKILDLVSLGFLMCYKCTMKQM